MIRVSTARLIRLAVLLVAITALVSVNVVEAQEEDRWAETMAVFEEADRTSPAPQNGVVFTGSSSIRRWNLEKWFPGMGYLNRGFGGSQIPDAIRHIDTVVLKHKPRLVVFYSGDNDTNAGKSGETVFADFKTFAGKVHAELPQTRIAVISIKPSVARWHVVDEVRKANDLMREFATQNDYIGFVDIEGTVLGWNGTPNPDLLVEDGLHMTPAGYAIWTAALKPFLGSSTATMEVPSSERDNFRAVSPIRRPGE